MYYSAVGSKLRLWTLTHCCFVITLKNENVSCGIFFFFFYQKVARSRRNYYRALFSTQRVILDPAIHWAVFPICKAFVLCCLLILQCNGWRKITASAYSLAFTMLFVGHQAGSSSKMIDELQHKGNTSSVLQPKQEETLWGCAPVWQHRRFQRKWMKNLCDYAGI